MDEVYGYLSNQWGFNETGRILIKDITKNIEEIGIKILNPFGECEKELDFKLLNKIKNYDKKIAYWENFSKKVTPTNNKLMRKSRCFFGLFDGGHSIDDGVASEVGYYAALVEENVIKKGKIFGLRTDFRGGDNPGCKINSQILGYVLQTGGKLDTSLDDFYKNIENWYNSLKEDDELANKWLEKRNYPYF